MSKHICPKCGNNRFITTAHVTQSWEVDENGNFIKEISTDEITHGPNDDNIWTCTKCGTEAIITTDKNQTKLQLLQQSIKNIKEYCNVTPCNECLVEKSICCGTNNNMKMPMCWDETKMNMTGSDRNA